MVWLTVTTQRTLHLTLTAWLLLSIWTQIASASPLPQNSGGTSSNNGVSYPANDTTLVDPFSAPDSLTSTKFTWVNCIYGLLFLFFGAVEVVHGYKYIRLTMLVAGFLAWASFAVMIMIVADIDSGKYQTSNVYFAVWFIVGAIGSLVSFYLWHIGIILTGAWGMFAVVAIVLAAANLQNYIIRYLILAIFLVLGGFLTSRFERVSVILATSLGGAYTMMFGLDMFVQTGFRATFHIILSQSTAQFHPVIGTWILIVLVFLIAIAGVIWELMHHEEPIGSWWFGHGARPLPEGDGKKRKVCCCCCGSGGGILARSRPQPKTVSSSPAVPKIVVSPSKKDKRRCCGGGSTSSAVSSSKTRARVCCIPLCCGKRSDKASTMLKPPTSAASPGGAATSGGVIRQHTALPVPHQRQPHYAAGHETIGHTEHHKIVIQKEVRDYYDVDIDERW